MRRRCDNCGTPLPGRCGHGFVTARGGVVCGRTKQERTVWREGQPNLITVSVPGCKG